MESRIQKLFFEGDGRSETDRNANWTSSPENVVGALEWNPGYPALLM